MSEPRAVDQSLSVAIDATSLLGQQTGVGIFTRELLGALALRDDLDLSAFAVSWRTRQHLASMVPPGVSTEQRAMPARPLHAAWSRVDFPKAESFLGAVDVLHGTNFTVPPSATAGRVVTVHDLTCVRYPELCQPATLRYPRLIARALRRGAIVHTPTVFIAEEVREHFKAPRESVVAVHSGVPSLPAADPTALREGIDLSRPYVLAVGTAEPRKDLPGLVAAFSAVATALPDLQLILAGPPGWGSEALEQAIAASTARDSIVTTGYVDGPALAALLERASVLAYPSIYEGFGFPPLQAMAAGVPVVVTRAGALVETVGDACLSVSIGDVDGLAAAIIAAVSDEAVRTILTTAGHARVADFTWDRTAEGLVDVYRRAATR